MQINKCTFTICGHRVIKEINTKKIISHFPLVQHTPTFTLNKKPLHFYYFFLLFTFSFFSFSLKMIRIQRLIYYILILLFFVFISFTILPNLKATEPASPLQEQASKSKPAANLNEEKYLSWFPHRY